MSKNQVRLHIYSAATDTETSLPFMPGGIRAGFPSPAEDYLGEEIDLNRELIQHKESTFYARVTGDSMRDMGIDDGDLIVIDKSIEAQSGDLVVAYLDGEFTLKQYKVDRKHNCAWLIPANEQYDPIKITEHNDFMIWGVMTYCIKQYH